MLFRLLCRSLHLRVAGGVRGAVAARSLARRLELHRKPGAALACFGKLRARVGQLAGARAGLATASEVFSDRAYESDGSLTPRALAGSLLTDPEAAAARLMRMIREGVVSSRQGTLVPVTATTACIHGDTPGSGDFARRLRSTLGTAGIAVAPFA